jgi:hypothetical protein
MNEHEKQKLQKTNPVKFLFLRSTTNSNESESEVDSDSENPKDSNDDMKTRKSQQKSGIF